MALNRTTDCTQADALETRMTLQQPRAFALQDSRAHISRDRAAKDGHTTAPAASRSKLLMGAPPGHTYL